MIDTHLYARYRGMFGDTFNVSLWAMRPGDAVNRMMEEALAGKRGALSDSAIANELAARLAALRNG